MPSSHPRLRINLNTLRANYAALQRRAARAQCGAVVKANAYGLGMRPVAQALFEQGCREFFVASLAEALELRAVLPLAGRILVLQGCEAGDESEFARAAITPVLISLPMAERYLGNLAKGPMPASCAIKLNTGMNRLGLDLPEFTYLLKRPEALHQAGFNLLISHLACADQPQHPLNSQQLQGFQGALGHAKALFPSLRASLANSAGIYLGPEFHFDLVRPGAALYGINPGFPRNPTDAVASLALQIMQLRSVPAGSAVGYGASYLASSERRLATVCGGYADGLLRAFGNRVEALVGGCPVPMVGRVSMDSLVFDVTDLQQPLVAGDWIELLGADNSADALALAGGTIGYEIYARLGERCQREYLGQRGFDAIVGGVDFVAN